MSVLQQAGIDPCPDYDAIVPDLCTMFLDNYTPEHPHVPWRVVGHLYQHSWALSKHQKEKMQHWFILYELRGCK